MTSETTTEMVEPDAPATAADPVAHADGAARNHLLVALVFLVVSVIDLVAAAIQLIEPDFLTGSGLTSFGRLMPMAINGFLYGFLTIGLLGAIYFVLPRATGAALRGVPLANLSLLLLVVGFGAGIVAIGLGMSEGRYYAEMPLWADVVAAAGMLLATIVVTRTARAGDAQLTPVQWYLVSAVHWLLLAHVVGNIPGLDGLASSFQASFHRASLIGLWIGAAGVGIVYYLIPRLTGRVAFKGTQLSVLGFWSLAFVWALTAPGQLTYSAAPDWLETLGAVFSISVFVPVAVIVADIVTAMRGRWTMLGDGITMRFVMAGAVAFAVLPLLNLMEALRVSSAVVGLTSWATGYEYVALLGAGSLWLMAFAHHASPVLLRGGGTTAIRRTHYNATVLGIVIAAGAMLFGGVQTGFTWAAGANSRKFANLGEGFVNTVVAMEAPNVVRLIGLIVFALAQVVFVVALFRRRPAGAPPPPVTLEAPEDDIPDDIALAQPIGLRKLRLGYVGLYAVAALFVLVLPSIEAEATEPTILADAFRFYPDGADATLGRSLYIEQGCVVCHTQNVRPIVTDVGLGAVSQMGDYAHEAPALVGWQRIGPDLMHAGTFGAGTVADHLADPRQLRPWSTMPSYDYLTDRELNALAAYIGSLGTVSFADEDGTGE